MNPIRTPDSERLDGHEVATRRGHDPVTIPRARPWGEVYRYLAEQWHPGEHMALVGRTRSGKTTFAREALMLRDWVCVLGTKPRDPDLYERFQAQGYVLKRSWSPFDTDNPRVIFAPPLPEPTRAGLNAQADAFRRALVQLFQLDVGGWTIYADELRYLTDTLKLGTEFDNLWLQGRAMGVTIVAATQRPRSVPQNMFQMADWLAFWRIPDIPDRDRASEMIGPQRDLAYETMGVLPPHEFLLVNTVQDTAIRGKVGA